MALDNSVFGYGRAAQPADLAGNFQKGMDAGKQYKTAQEEQAIKEAMKANTVAGPDGKVSLNRSAMLSSIQQINPQKAMEMERDFQKQDYEKMQIQANMKKDLAWSVHDQASHTAARQKAIELGIPGAEQTPEIWDPNTDKAYKYHTLNEVQQLAQQNFNANLESHERDRIESRRQAYALAGERAQERNDVREEKREDKMAQLAVPGYQRTGEVMAKPEEAAKFRKAIATAEQLKAKLNRMKELVKDKGSFEWGGKEGQEMESLATEIQLLGKGPELYELGVLAGPDLTLLNKITADPSSWSSLFTKDSTRQKQLDTQINSLNTKLDATSKSLGYSKADVAQTQSGPKPGTIEDGHIFSGGDPSNPANWKPVSKTAKGGN